MKSLKHSCEQSNTPGVAISSVLWLIETDEILRILDKTDVSGIFPSIVSELVVFSTKPRIPRITL